MLITAANEKAIAQSIHTGMVAADAKAMVPSLTVIDDQPRLAERLLKRIAKWCIRFSPSVAVDGDDGLILDATGCTHLSNGDDGLILDATGCKYSRSGDAAYLDDITSRFCNYGYTVRVAIADTIVAAW